MFLKLNQWLIYRNNKKRIGIFAVSRKVAELQRLKLFSLLFGAFARIVFTKSKSNYYGNLHHRITLYSRFFCGIY